MKSRREFVSLHDTKGLIINDLMEITPSMKVFIASNKQEIKGITGLQSLETEEYKTNENKEKYKQNFLKAWEKWIDENPVQTTEFS